MQTTTRLQSQQGWTGMSPTPVMEQSACIQSTCPWASYQQQMSSLQLLKQPSLLLRLEASFPWSVDSHPPKFGEAMGTFFQPSFSTSGFSPAKSKAFGRESQMAALTFLSREEVLDCFLPGVWPWSSSSTCKASPRIRVLPPAFHSETHTSALL